MPRLFAAASLLLFASTAESQAVRENLAVPNNGPTTLPLGTTRGERVNRLIIRGATVLSGRGTPGTNRAMPPEGPVDIVIENGVITDMIPMDAVNAAGYRNAPRATGDKIIDATGQYVMPWTLLSGPAAIWLGCMNVSFTGRPARRHQSRLSS